MSQIILQTLDFASIGTPPVGEFYLGVDTDGIMKLKRNTDTLILSVTGSQFLQYTLVTYSDFLNLYNTSSLQPGGVYLINDFRTTHYVQFTDAVGDGTGLGESINYGSIEPIIVLATSTNSYDTNVKSLNYPDDEIKWLHEVTDREYDHFNNPSGTGRGHIIFRKSKSGNSRNYDFRNVIFYRWNDGSGNYTISRKIDAPNIFDYVSYKAFEEGFTDLRDNQIGSQLLVPNDFSKPYYLDNLVITTQSQALGNNIKFAFETTISSLDFSYNTIDLVSDSLISGNFILNDLKSLVNSDISTASYNNIYEISDSNISNLNYNKGLKIDNSSIQTIEFNNFASILSSTFSLFNYNNITDVSGIQVTTFSQNVTALTKDKTEILNFNSGRIILSSNLEFNPLLGTFARVLTENNNLVFSTSSAYLTSTASGGFMPYLGIGTTDPKKKLHISNSGILIDGTQSEQLQSLNDPNWSRFVIDTGLSLTQSFLDLRNNNGRILYVGGSSFPSISVGTNSTNHLLTLNNFSQNVFTVGTAGQINIATISQNSLIDNFLVWNSSTGLISYRSLPDIQIVDINTSTYSPTLTGQVEEYFGVSYSSTHYFTLPQLSSVNNGKVIRIKDESGLAAVNPIVIEAGNSTIDGFTQSTLAISYGSLTLIKKSNGWWII